MVLLLTVSLSLLPGWCLASLCVIILQVGQWGNSKREGNARGIKHSTLVFASYSLVPGANWWAQSYYTGHNSFWWWVQIASRSALLWFSNALGLQRKLIWGWHRNHVPLQGSKKTTVRSCSHCGLFFSFFLYSGFSRQWKVTCNYTCK